MVFLVEKSIDRTIGSILCSVFGILPKRNVKKYDRVLFVKLWALGESILTLPLIKAFKDKYPSAHIAVLVRKRNKAVYEGLPFIDEVLLFEPKHLPSLFVKLDSFDLAFDLEPYMNLSALLGWWLSRSVSGFSHGSRSKLYAYKTDFNDKQHEVLTYMDLARSFGVIDIPKELVQLVYSVDDLSFVNKLLNELRVNRPIVGICAGAAESAKSRMWARDRFAELADRLVEQRRASIVFTGTLPEKELNDEIISRMKYKNNAFNLAGKLSLRQLFAFCTLCKVFVSNDTGPMHVAAAMGTKTVGLFCPNTPVRFAPYGSRNASVFKPVFPEPCINVHKGEVPDCEGHNHMSNIQVDDVLNAVMRLW